MAAIDLENSTWEHVPISLKTSVKLFVLHGCLKRLFIDFLTKKSNFTSENVGNLVLVSKYVKLTRFQPILKLYITLVEILFTLKPFKAVYW